MTEKDPNRQYSFRVNCKNCGGDSLIMEKFGTPVNVDKLKKECPGCGCSAGWTVKLR